MSAIQIKIPFSLRKVFQTWAIFLVFSPIMSGYSWNNAGKGVSGYTNFISTPIFDESTLTEVDANVGQTLLLPCIVRNLKDRVVSWIRTTDLHILTFGRLTYSSDNRFESVHTSSSGDFWGLRIRGVQLSDTGQYECQVNTDPKMSLFVKLNVKQPENLSPKWVSQALIMGPSHVYVKNGDNFTLTCIISPLFMASSVSAHRILFNTKPPVRWLHDGHEIFFERNRNTITIENSYGETDLRINSKLHLAPVTWKDSGQYSCMQPSTKPDTIKLSVSEGEHSEAMQRDYPSPYRPSGAQTASILNIAVHFFVLIILLCIT